MTTSGTTGTSEEGGEKDWGLPNDPFGAFCRDNHIALDAAATGLLSGMSFAAKDVMDIAGSVAGFGQPTWLKTHEPASRNSPVIDLLLNAGARLVGKTISDELTYSLTGENVHYGTPANPGFPARVPGGSSSGSVSAVAGEIVDFSLGTDCAGSVRLPASYCGIYGMRPSHGLVSTDGVIPFAPSIDTVGWFARDPNTLRNVGSVLLAEHFQKQPDAPGRLLIATDSFDLVEAEIRNALMPAVDRLRGHFSSVEEIAVGADGLESWMECFRVVQGAEIWNSLGDWITKAKPELGPGIVDRVAAAREITADQVTPAIAERARKVAHLQQLLRPGDVICQPTSPRIAPLKDTATSTVEVTYRYQAICLLSIAGLGGLPEISLPLAQVDGCPLGLSIIGRAGADRQLLDLAIAVSN